MTTLNSGRESRNKDEEPIILANEEKESNKDEEPSILAEDGKK